MTAGALVRPKDMMRYSKCPTAVERCLPLIFLMTPHQVVGIPLVQLGEDGGFLKGLKNRDD